MALGRWREETGREHLPFRGLPDPTDFIDPNFLLMPSYFTPVLTKVASVVPGAQKALPNSTSNTRGLVSQNDMPLCWYLGGNMVADKKHKVSMGNLVGR